MKQNEASVVRRFFRWVPWWLLIFPLGLLGLWRLRQTNFAALAVWVMLAQVAFETLVMAGWGPRYRLPIDLMLIAAAGVVYADWAGRWLMKTPAPSGQD